ncbi:MAG TPA: serine/threonine-protein kinase, partial [Kofleriaceae bacterium]|nr:serine/threonine-protein kinase [Kofleriaceae bacterium]
MLGDDSDRRRRATLTASRETIVERAPDDPPIGATFDDRAARFETLGELGRGGMGSVVDAFDHTLVRRVAIKNVLDSDAAALARFEREVLITACLEHPSIVPLYDAGRDASGKPYYVMRRVDGQPLDAATRDTPGERLALVPNVLAACDAVAFAHARSIVHRDLKPSNILLGPFGETLVIDWGLARSLDERGAAEIAGTPGFMAPEQERGEALDPRADVYALGATLRYVLAGRDAPLPREVPDDLRAIVDKALANDPARRYPDASGLAADLRRFLTGRLVAAHRYRLRDRLRRFVRRHRAAVSVAAVSTVVLAVVLAITLERIVDERDL